jgi:two-component system response regulator
MELIEVEILLVEDNDNDAELAIRSLTKNSISNKIMRLRNGVEALDFLFGKGDFSGRDISNKPKVVLLDLKMPKVDGLEVLQQIKNSEITKSIPVVMLTSSKEDPDIARCYALGVNSYIVKPVDFSDFHNAVIQLGMYWILTNQPPVK